MAGTKSKKDNAISNHAGKKNERDSGRLLIVIGVAAVVVLGITSCIYAYNNKVGDIWWTYFGEIFQEWGVGVFSGEGLLALLCKWNPLKEKNIDVGGGVKYFVIVIFITIFLTILGGIMKIKGEIEARKTEENNSLFEEEKHVELEPEETENPQSIYQKKQYMLSDDYFVEDLTAYYGVEKGSISKEEQLNKKVNLIYEDIKMLEKQKEVDTEIPKEYLIDINRADAQYETYVFQRDRDWYEESDFIKRQEWRLGDLAEAKKYRLEADIEYKDASNLRLVASYCLDEGDEYMRCSQMAKDESIKQDKKGCAERAYREGAEMCMEAIYIAAQENDEVMMNTILDDTFSKIEQAAEDASVSEMYLVYQKVVEML